MPGCDHFRPVARASGIFAERWTPLIVGELLAGHEHFSRIRRGLHRVSPRVLRQRLCHLEQGASWSVSRTHRGEDRSTAWPRPGWP